MDGWRFAASVDYSLAANTLVSALAVGDLDGDGKPEIVAANDGAPLPALAVLHNRGNGTFDPAVTYASGSLAYAVAIGDVDGDGKADLALAGNGVEILHNRGDGTFDAPLTYPAPSSEVAIALADLDGNGSLDVAAVSSLSYVDGANVFLLLNEGHGMFGPALRYPGTTTPTSLVAADLNGDGRAELVVVDEGAPPNAGGVHVLVNQGNGTFTPGATATTDSLAQKIAVADFDDDGDLDLAVMTQWHDSVRVLSNRGDAMFEVAGDYFVTGIGVGIVAADFNGDHLADIAGTGFAVEVLFNHGHNTFVAAQEQAVPYSTVGVAVGDVDGDGKVDAVVASTANSSTATDVVSVLLQRPDGTLGTPTNYPAGKWVYAVATGDVDGDGALDAVVANNLDDTISVLINKGHGVFGAPTAYPAGAGPMSVALADFDGDGALDVGVGHFGDATLTVLHNDGHGAFATSMTLVVGNKPKRIAAGDLDGNKSVDLIAANYDDNTVSVLLNQGNGTFAAAVTYAAGTSPSSIALGDVDGDGDLDVAVTHDYDYGEKDIAVLANDGHGALATAVTHGAGGSQTDLTIGDINGDGRADLVFSASSVSLGVMLGDGAGGFGVPYGFVAGGTRSPVLVDFDGDKKVDVVAVGTTCSVLRNTSR